MTARIRDYLRRNPSDEGPRLVVDLDVVRENYNTFAKALPDTRVFYAVKANPAPEVLALLASLGSCFDTASVPEIEMALAAGASADRIFDRTSKNQNRPLLRTEDPRARIDQLLAERDPLYREIADVVVDTDHRGVRGTVNFILRQVGKPAAV